MNILIQLLKLAPQIIAAMIAIEGVVTTPKSGQTKKDLVLASLDAVAKVGEGVDNKLVAAISVFIDNAVTAMNTGKVLTPVA
jgi:hypothetical protein